MRSTTELVDSIICIYIWISINENIVLFKGYCVISGTFKIKYITSYLDKVIRDIN